MKNQTPTIVRKLKASLAFALLALIIIYASGCGSDPDPEPTDPCDGVTITFDLTQTGCDEITVGNVKGGAGSYEYSIDGTTFQSNEVLSGVTGTATITVRDANKCTGTDNITLETLSLEASGDSYTITAASTGGVEPYQYSIDGTTFQSEATFEVDEAKDYTVTVKDGVGCTTTATVKADKLSTTTDSRDDQEYNVVKIGDQVWFAENFNLNTNTTDSTSSWYYDDDSTTYAADYGRLYTWHVAKVIAPEGWRLPKDEDVSTLETYLGGNTVAGGKMNVGGSSGFEGKLAGSRVAPNYYNMGSQGYFWEQTEYDATNGNMFNIETSNYLYTSSSDKSNGLSVRFIKE